MEYICNVPKSIVGNGAETETAFNAVISTKQLYIAGRLSVVILYIYIYIYNFNNKN